MQDYWNYLRLSDFLLGVSSGWAFPGGQDNDWHSSVSTGIYTALVFSPRIKLWADVRYLNTGLVSGRMDPAIGIPIVEPPSDDFKFLKAEARQPSLQYTGGVTWSFLPGRRLNPFVGLGYALVSRFPYEVIYEFEKNGTGIEWAVDKPVRQNAFFTDYGMLAGGLDQRLSKYWNLQLKANYRKGFGKESKNYMPQLFDLQFILIRKF